MATDELPADCALPVEAAIRLGFDHQQAGRLQEAEDVYRRVLASAPGNPDALHLLGLVAWQRGDLEAAAELMARSLEADATRSDFAINLSQVLWNLGRLDEAAARLDRALASDPSNGALHHLLGNVLKERGRPEAAEQSLRRAAALAPERTSVHADLGILLHDRERFAEAIDCLGKAVEENPRSTDMLNRLGVSLRAAGRYEEALDRFRRALALEPERPEILYNLGNTLADAHRSQEAVHVFRRLLAVKPGHVAGHVHLAFALLVLGEFEQGWKEYEWRWRIAGFPGPRYDFEEPLWTGGSLEGKTILLLAEQGLGDVLHFIRYAPLIAERGGRVMVEVPAVLDGLIARVPSVSRTLAPESPLPSFDCYQRLMSLPGVFGTTPATIPARVPYLAADPARASAWTRRLEGLPRPRIGVAWRGSTQHPNDRNRSCPFPDFAPVLAKPGFTFVSLQKDRRDDDEPLPPPTLDAAPELRDFDDAAAAVAALDLVVAVDTAVAHLAGGLGRPVWTLLPFAPDWRWSLGREDSPWYPTMRLFRQPAPGEWRSTLAAVGRALDEFGAGGGGRRRQSRSSIA